MSTAVDDRMSITGSAGRFSFGRVVVIAGAIAAFLIGSGFATGQEIMQYFTSYGWWGIIGTGAIVLIGMTFVCVDYLAVGNAMKFDNPSRIYHYYGGKVLGTFYEWFSVFFIYLSFIVMIAGAGAVFDEHYGLPVWMGGVFIAITAGGTVIFGLKRLVDIIGRVGPLIITVSILLAIAGIVVAGRNIAPNATDVLSMDMTRAGANWFMSGLSYVGFSMLWLATFLAALGGASKSRKEAISGGMLGGALFSAACIIVGLALLATLATTAGAQIPMLVLAGEINSSLGVIISVIILGGIYTTAVPLLWTSTQRVNGNVDRGGRFIVIVTVAAVVGLLIGLNVPFATIVNYVYVINGYVAILLLALMIGHAVYRLVTGKSIEESGFVKAEPALARVSEEDGR